MKVRTIVHKKHSKKQTSEQHIKQKQIKYNKLNS